jgi:murein DD-endopeptidase MepM/ murein hydrolase activator NlpD
MKNRFIITISDIHGSKQYSIHEIIKKIIFFTVLTFVLLGVLTFFYIKYLNNKVDELRVETEHFKQEMITLKATSNSLKEENEQLNILKKQLVALIDENTDKLDSMKSHLREVEEIIGIGPDINASDADRIQQAKEHEEETKKKLVENIQNEAKKEKVTAIQKALLLNSIPNGKPLNYRRIASPFGYRIHPVTHKNTFHAGLDLPAKHGTPVYAPASGVVVYAAKKGAYGNFMLIAHSYGFKTAYGHLSKFAVKSGDYVTKGQKIAYVGSTGRSTGPHLHYEIRFISRALNPIYFVKWNNSSFKEIFKKEKYVPWESLVNMINNRFQIQKQQSSLAVQK